ncbi:MAG: hypothetical protein HY426_01565 [Candidatus Levybacteria bacterium]|nr:hypothetical protein [Candidatus Levybacteria bacterium]
MSGAVRAETARIWMPYVPIFILVVARFLTDKLRFKRKQFIFLLILLAAQLLIFQTVLVTVW